jgi:hypothetical protein
MKVVFKVVLFALSTVTVLAVMALYGMPGMRHGDEHIAGDYYFSHNSAGGFQMSISEKRNGEYADVVHMKVEQFIVHANTIFVTQRPVVPKEGSNLQLANTCLYYQIDVVGHKVSAPFTLAEVKDRADWAFLKQSRPPEDWGETRCQLDDIKG